MAGKSLKLQLEKNYDIIGFNSKFSSYDYLRLKPLCDCCQWFLVYLVPLSGAATPFCGLLTPKCFLRVRNHLFL